MAATACTENHSAPDTPLFTTVQTHGCAFVARGPRCLLTETSTLVVWTDGPAGARELRIDGVERSARWEAVEGGFRAHVEVTPSHERVEVVAPGARWRASVARAPTAPWAEAVQAAVARGDVERAEARLSQIDEARPVAERALAAQWRGRLAWRASRPDTAALRAAAAALAEQADLLSLAVDEHLAAGHAHLHIDGDVTAARAELATARALAAGTYARGAVLADELGAQIDLTIGDRRSASRALERMARGARRLDAEDIRWAAVLISAQNLMSMGRTERAARLLETIAESPATRGSPCREALLLNHRAWAALMAAELGHAARRASPRADLDRALALHRGACRDRGAELDDLLSLALFELQRGDAEAAARHLETAQGKGATRIPRTADWYLDLAGRVALADGRPEAARRAYARLAEIAERTASRDGRWRAEVGRAKSLAAAGDLEGAADAYRSAERRLEAQSLTIALEDDRGRFLADHARYTRDQVALLRALGRDREAIATIRRARSRLLTHLDRDARLGHLTDEARAGWGRAMTRIRSLRDEIDGEVEAAWRLSEEKLAAREARRLALERALERALDEAVGAMGPARAPPLPPVAPGQVALGYHRGPDGWLGFARTATAARVEDLGAIDLADPPEALAAALLEPFAATLARAERIRILASSGLEEVDVHALPWRGAPLIHTYEIVYALDLAPRSASATAAAALVVSDPAGNLPRARREGRSVQAILTEAGLPVDHLSGARATARATRAALGRVGHFHYAGHARSGSDDGWDSALLLADKARLDPGAALTLPRVPSTAFLSGCETARTDDRAVLTLGLAQAFVLAGSAEVIASVRPVDDATTERIARAVYASGLAPLAPALRRAQIELSRSTPSADWAAFRVIVP